MYKQQRYVVNRKRTTTNKCEKNDPNAVGFFGSLNSELGKDNLQIAILCNYKTIELGFSDYASIFFFVPDFSAVKASSAVDLC